MVLSGCRTGQWNQLRGRAAEMVTAARDAARLQGALAEFLEVHSEGATSSKGCLGTDGSRSSAVQGRTGLESAHGACVLSWEPVRPGAAQPTVLTKSGVTGTLATAIAHGALTAGGKSCDINSPHSAFNLNDGGNGVNLGGQRPQIAAGFFSLDGTGLEHEALNAVDSLKGTKPLIYHACQAAGLAEATKTAFKLPKMETKHQEKNFKKQARKYILILKPDDTSKDNEIQTSVQAAFTSEDNLQKIFISQIDETTIPANVSDQAQN
ncbi:Trypanosome variant surface glycoprotein (A-type) [Trypanosoma brucei equiperdum]|uniref:Trypanosome variant surface glycoprotein (A-type) n=1 Tax=Trypanosoma brucei equiperdum TaxID=630700 RepID=A0A3L6KQ27_9TRYP|nr:Trypanosome variant surface glycoprotein (A-type) [Trypanosoma brucei equiperdum]RHW66858.1 Trypanosome variant surface glycoprotein (A-type) [Trypanosoma brucei equiperdum]RHW66861.1 Trypanosome variant surface glycoprotein (A-type) [Trypanosoma brucei equiperdum]RHW66894.1 Trypanosome variant surface glycoprotein (A-type) [Trypanosoma brucei equiperdum]